MRTKNHFCVGEGPAGFGKILSGHYPAGRVAVLCRNLTEGQRVASPLLGKYKISLFSTEENAVRKEDVRFVIGVGGPEIVEAVRDFAGDARFAFYANCPDHRFLNDFDGTGRLSEFVYLDKETLNADRGVISAYSALFCVWAESRLRLFEKSYLPFCDKVLLSYAQSAEKALGGECDREEFFSEALRLIAVISGRLKDCKGLYVAAAAPDLTPEGQFIGAYFALSLTFNFTKIPFGAILNLSEEEDKRDYLPSALPDREKLRSYARRMKAMTALPETEKEDLLALLSASRSPYLPLLSGAAERGLFEGSENEKITRHRRIFV